MRGTIFSWLYDRRAFATAVAAASLAVASALPASAVLSLDRSVTDFATVSLGADRDVAAPGDIVSVVLHQQLARGWHTYWVNAGDSGVAAMLNWTAPDGVEIGPVEWAAPERIPVPPLMTYGYTDEATLVSAFRVPEDWPIGEPIELSLSAIWLVCEHICVQEAGVFSLSIPTGAEPVVDGFQAGLADAARDASPDAFQGSVEASADGGDLVLRVLPDGADGDVATIDAYFFPFDRALIQMAADQSATPIEGGFELRAPLADPDALDAAAGGVLRYIDLSGATPMVRIVEVAFGGEGDAAAAGGAGPAESGGGGAPVMDEGGAVDLASAPTVPEISLATALVFALVGGLILNLMPCVFPVLALKALSIAGSAGAPRAERLAHGGAYVAGVMASFLGFAAILIAVQGLGGAFVWGFQLQNGLVVAALAYVMFVVGLNLSGVFEVSIGSAANVGSGLADRGGSVGSFFTGVLAAVVASPCTAPLMGVALGFALTQDAATALLVFAALGVGFSAPIAVLWAAPAVARHLPRPGPWMVRFRQALAFPMYVAAAWLLSVLGGLAGVDAIFWAMVGMVALAMALWALGAGRPDGRGARRIAAAAAVLLTAAAAGALAPSAYGAPQADDGGPPLAQLDAARADGRSVFVNVTADWCITCKVVEATVFSSVAFEQLMLESGAAYVTVDFTQQDDEIAAYLHSFGRAGVPLYVVYTPGEEPVILPQFPTVEDLRSALSS